MMNGFSAFLTGIAGLVFLAGCEKNIEPQHVIYPDLEGTPLDYSKGENWMVKQDRGDAEVDVFYLYPTANEMFSPEKLGEINHYVKSLAYIGYEKGASCFDEYANIFVPYYHQFSYLYAMEVNDYFGFLDKMYKSVIRTDIYAALDFFFENYNNGRPYILAGLSQGAYGMQIVLSEYMKLHPEYYSRMIACYAVAAVFDSEYMAANPHLKTASGETDTGVIISWNTESEGGSGNSIIFIEGAYCINPLNWKTDDTYADASENLGTYMCDSHTIVPGLIDSRLNTERGVLVTTTAEKNGYQPLPVELGIGSHSFHMNEWDFFYENIKENAKKRIASFMRDGAGSGKAI